MQKFFQYLPGIISLIMALAGISFFFTNYDNIGRMVQSALKLETDPAFTGGRTAAVIYDPVGDDKGYGSLVYPRHPDFAAHALDLIRYTVHEPVCNAKWSNMEDFWQLDLSFGSGPAKVRNIRIYIDADGDGKGNTAAYNEVGEGVTFDPDFPWDYMVAVGGTEGRLISADGSVLLPVSVSESVDGKDITLRIPLSDRRLQGLYLADRTAHYVYVGGWTPWGYGGFLPVARRAAYGTGGGASSAFTPPLYDCLVPEGCTQEALLSAWDEEAFKVPVLLPVEIPMHAGTGSGTAGSGSPESGAKAVRLAELATAAKREAAAASEAAQAVFKAVDSGSDREYALAAFNAGMRQEAEAAFDRILAAEPGNSTAHACKGSLIALRGKNAAPLAAVDIIAEAYRHLDEAVALARAPDEILNARLNRGNVSLAVPDTIFGKALQGAADFLAAADAYRALNGKDSSAETACACFNAALCFAAGGKEEVAGTWFREAARIVLLINRKTKSAGTAVPASLMLELLKRGYLSPESTVISSAGDM